MAMRGCDTSAYSTRAMVSDDLPLASAMMTSSPSAQGGARNAPHQLSRPLDKILQFHGGAGEGQPSWMRRPVGSGEAHLDAAQSSGQLTLTSPLASAMAGGAMAGAHLRRNDLMALPMSSGPDSPRSVSAACTSAHTTCWLLVPAPCVRCRTLAVARA